MGYVLVILYKRVTCVERGRGPGGCGCSLQVRFLQYETSHFLVDGHTMVFQGDSQAAEGAVNRMYSPVEDIHERVLTMFKNSVESLSRSNTSYSS